MTDATASSPRASASRIVVLAPPNALLPETFHRVACAPDEHDALLADVQRLRGRVYLADGAVAAHELDAQGRHRQPSDRAAWHLLALGDDGAVAGCLRYHVHAPRASFGEFALAHSSLAACPAWGPRLRAAIARAQADARRRDWRFVELGGWAIAPEARGSKNGVKLVLASYALANAMGGCTGVSTATVRNASAAILHRLGGAALQAPDGAALPPYYDARHRCEMHVIRFDSSLPDADLGAWIDAVGEELADARVVCAGAATERARRTSGMRFTAASTADEATAGAARVLSARSAS